ncbi:MAG: hypothetical protein MI924_19750 [Chloroflexales bacterium]|nr:hypothetical protein [Chloroflexales bacterium]
MTTLTVLLPILPGKLEAWRRMLQDIEELHDESYQAWRDYVGFTNEQVWLVKAPPDGAAARVMWESELRPAVLWQRLAHPSPFQRWLRRRLREVHGIDLAWMGNESCTELVFNGQVKAVHSE